MPDLSMRNSNNVVETLFVRINNITMYTGSVDVFRFLTSNVDETYSRIQKFPNCIFSFNGLLLLVSNIDVLYHNRRYQDNCAYSLKKIDK